MILSATAGKSQNRENPAKGSNTRAFSTSAVSSDLRVFPSVSARLVVKWSSEFHLSPCRLHPSDALAIPGFAAWQPIHAFQMVSKSMLP